MKPPRWLTRKRYRVIEVVKGDNSSKFYPQKQYRLLRFTLFWKNMVDEGYANNPARVYTSLEEANKYLYELDRDERHATTIKKKTHEFNAVFHKLGSDN